MFEWLQRSSTHSVRETFDPNAEQKLFERLATAKSLLFTIRQAHFAPRGISSWDGDGEPWRLTGASSLERLRIEMDGDHEDGDLGELAFEPIRVGGPEYVAAMASISREAFNKLWNGFVANPKAVWQAHIKFTGTADYGQRLKITWIEIRKHVMSEVPWPLPR